MKNKIAPSMMCADPSVFSETLSVFEQQGVEYLHIDIMDGQFVQNFTLGPDYCRALKKHTSIPLDLHLMIEEPERKLTWFPIGEGDFVSVHLESTRHLQGALARIRAMGAKPMAAINPATPVELLEPVLPDLDGILIMTVNPGFAGQKLIPATLHKIRKTRALLDNLGYNHMEIEVDGNVSFENAVKMKTTGANIFVAGTSSVFSSSFSLDEGLRRLRALI